LDRRAVLKGMSGAALGLVASLCGSPSQASPPSAASPSNAPARSAVLAQSAPTAGGAGGRETVYVFNVGSRDVTLIDVADRRVRETRLLGASVRWLSDEQTY